MSTTQSNDIDTDRRREADMVRDWEEKFVDDAEPEGRWTDDEGFGGGAISAFPGLTPATRAYYERVDERLEETTGTGVDPFGPEREDFDEHVKNCFVSGYPSLYAALLYARAKSLEKPSRLSIPTFRDRDAQRFLQVGIPIADWPEEVSTFTGEELNQWLYHAEAGPDVLNSEAEWPSSPGERFEPADGMELVRLC